MPRFTAGLCCILEFDRGYRAVAIDVVHSILKVAFGYYSLFESEAS